MRTSAIAALGQACRKAALGLGRALGLGGTSSVDMLKSPIGLPSIDVGQFGVSTWASELAPRSTFMRLIADNAFGVRGDFHTRIGVPTSPALGYAVDEGKAVPISSMSLAWVQLPRMRVEAAIPCSQEQLLEIGTPGESAINRSLVNALAKAIDQTFFQMLISTDTFSIPASANCWSDLRAASLEVASESGQIYVVTDPKTAAKLATLSSGGLPVFPAVGLDGGVILDQPLIVSSGCPAGSIILLNADAIAAGVEVIQSGGTRHATLEMRNDPIGSSATPTGTTLVSLFQTNTAALAARTAIGAVALRDDAIVVITTCDYGAGA